MKHINNELDIHEVRKMLITLSNVINVGLLCSISTWSEICKWFRKNLQYLSRVE